MERIKSVRDFMLDGQKPKEEKKDNYIPLDLDVALSEHNEYVQSGESCRIDALKDIFAWMRGFVSSWYGWANDGKMEWIENKLLTPTGFVRMGDLRVGDKLFDENGNICEVTYATNFQFDKKCFKLTFNDGETVICGEEHLWLTYNNAELRSFNSYRNRKRKTTHKNQNHRRVLPKVRT